MNQRSTEHQRKKDNRKLMQQSFSSQLKNKKANRKDLIIEFTLICGTLLAASLIVSVFRIESAAAVFLIDTAMVAIGLFVNERFFKKGR